MTGEADADTETTIPKAAAHAIIPVSGLANTRLTKSAPSVEAKR
jgi:hypothetical protein